MEKFFRDMNKKKINSTLIVQNLGDFVCGANSFLRMQSKRSEDLFERFRSHGRLSRGESDSSTTSNDYGPDRKYSVHVYILLILRGWNCIIIILLASW